VLSPYQLTVPVRGAFFGLRFRPLFAASTLLPLVRRPAGLFLQLAVPVGVAHDDYLLIFVSLPPICLPTSSLAKHRMCLRLRIPESRTVGFRAGSCNNAPPGIEEQVAVLCDPLSVPPGDGLAPFGGPGATRVRRSCIISVLERRRAWAGSRAPLHTSIRRWRGNRRTGTCGTFLLGGFGGRGVPGIPGREV
jgi:hypothetical protein